MCVDTHCNTVSNHILLTCIPTVHVHEVRCSLGTLYMYVAPVPVRTASTPVREGAACLCLAPPPA